MAQAQIKRLKWEFKIPKGRRKIKEVINLSSNSQIQKLIAVKTKNYT